MNSLLSLTVSLVMLVSAGTVLAGPVTVGLISSGSEAGPGMEMTDGFMLAVREADNPDLEVIEADDQNSPELAVMIAHKLIETGRVDVLTGITTAATAEDVIPEALAQKKFYLSASPGPADLAGAGCNPFYFNLAAQDDDLFEAAAAYASSTGLKNTFLLAPNDLRGQTAFTGFKRAYTGQLSGELFTLPGQTDYSDEIAQIRASGADSVFFFLPGDAGAGFLTQYAQSGVEVPLLGTAYSLDQDMLGRVGKAALGVKNTAQWSNDLDNATNAAFVAAFQKAYGRPPSLQASLGYDTARLLLSAMAQADVHDPDAFRAALAAARFDSVRGHFAFAQNHFPIQDIFVRQVVAKETTFTNRIVGVALTNHASTLAPDCKM